LDLGVLFVPPDPNFLGWNQQLSTHNPVLFANIDYAGLAAPYGTGITPSFAGNVTERPLADGRAEVSVSLHTKNANAWIVSIDQTGDPDQLKTSPPLFGHRPQEVRDGASQALADSLLETTFINSAPGAPLPDLLDLAFNHPENLKSVRFNATGFGPLT